MLNREDQELARIAQLACDRARGAGAQQAAAKVTTGHQHKVLIRDGKQEELKSSISRSLSLRLYVDGRYGHHSTSVLGEKELDRFTKQAVEMTRLLMPDKHRSLPDPALYKDRSDVDLGIFDADHTRVTVTDRKKRALEAHEAGRATAGDKTLSVGAGALDDYSASVTQTTNGFLGVERSTAFWVWAMVSVKDPGGSRPSEWEQGGARTIAKLVDPSVVGRRAAQRALERIGAKKLASVTLPVIVENRAVSRVLSEFFAPLSGRALDQKRSCFEGKLEQQIAAPLLSVSDDPFVVGGWGSRHFDGEGISARKRPVIEKGRLKTFFIDDYYGRKLELKPTSGDSSNLVFATGTDDLDGLCRQADQAILVTSFLGGNSNGTTGDFSHGIEGYLIEKGQRSQPLASMNVSGNHLQWWGTLQAVGSDPYLHASSRTPSLLFAPMVIAGK